MLIRKRDYKLTELDRLFIDELMRVNAKLLNSFYQQCSK